MIKIKAIDLMPGDVVNTRKVNAVIPNYLRKGQTEVVYDDKTTEFIRNERTVEVLRPKRIRDAKLIRAKTIA